MDDARIPRLAYEFTFLAGEEMYLTPTETEEAWLACIVVVVVVVVVVV